MVNFLHSGRKISLPELREKMLKEQQPYLRTFPDEYYENISNKELEKEYDRIDEKFDSALTKSELVDKLKSFHRRRHISFWHDGSSISNHGHLLVTVTTTYDTAIFYTDDEYFEKTGTFSQLNKTHHSFQHPSLTTVKL